MNDPAIEEWKQLTQPCNKTEKRFGSGEAAIMAYTRFHGGTIASNNLSDILDYCVRYCIEFISTDNILCLGVVGKYISMDEAENLRQNMKKRRIILPNYDFEEAYRRFLNDLPKN